MQALSGPIRSDRDIKRLQLYSCVATLKARCQLQVLLKARPCTSDLETEYTSATANLERLALIFPSHATSCLRDLLEGIAGFPEESQSSWSGGRQASLPHVQVSMFPLETFPTDDCNGQTSREELSVNLPASAWIRGAN